MASDRLTQSCPECVRLADERDALRDASEVRSKLLLAVAAACRGLEQPTDEALSVLGNVLTERDSLKAEVERLRAERDLWRERHDKCHANENVAAVERAEAALAESQKREAALREALRRLHSVARGVASALNYSSDYVVNPRELERQAKAAEKELRAIYDAVLSSPPPPVTLPASGKTMWFSYDPEDGFECHDTEEAARKRADEAIDAERENAAEGWSENVGDICFGVVLGYAALTTQREPTEEERARYGWDDVHDYSLVASGATAPTPMTGEPTFEDAIRFVDNVCRLARSARNIGPRLVAQLRAELARLRGAKEPK